jgi:hypothetical protein
MASFSLMFSNSLVGDAVRLHHDVNIDQRTVGCEVAYLKLRPREKDDDVALVSSLDRFGSPRTANFFPTRILWSSLTVAWKSMFPSDCECSMPGDLGDLCPYFLP